MFLFRMGSLGYKPVGSTKAWPGIFSKSILQGLIVYYVSGPVHESGHKEEREKIPAFTYHEAVGRDL